MLRPSQYALKLPATNPARILSDAPPSLDAVTTSLTWLDSVDVNTLTSSGMIAPASVPHVMIAASFHHNVPSPRSGISSRDTTKVRATEMMDVSQTSDVSGASKFIRVTLLYRLFATASFSRYAPTLTMIIITRMTKIQTSSFTCVSGVFTASMMNVMSATPVTP